MIQIDQRNLSGSDFLLSTELREYRDTLRRFFADAYPADKLKDAKRSAPDTWKSLADLGVLIASIPENQGGLGFGLLAAALAVEEAAFVLAPLPVFETLAFGVFPLLSGTVTSRGAGLLGVISTGEAKVSGGFVEDGMVSFVPIGEEVERFVVIDGNAICLAVNPARESIETLDLVRPFARIGVGTIEELGTAASRDRLSGAIAVLAAAELVGAGRRVEQMMLEHLKTRKQFGRAIGTFQANQHRAADIHLALQLSESLNRFAAWAYDNDTEQFEASALAAKAVASEMIPRAIEAALQAHGGIAFTWEYDLHYYLRRAQVMSRLYGESKRLCAKLAQVHGAG